MSTLSLSEWNTIIGIIGGIIGAVGVLVGLWLTHRANVLTHRANEKNTELSDKELKLKEREFELNKEKQSLDKKRFELEQRKHEWEEKEHILKEIDTLSQLRKDPDMSKWRHVIYDAYHEFMNTGSKSKFETEEYRRAVHEVVEEIEMLGGRLKYSHDHETLVDRFSDSDWKVIMYSYEAIEPYNEEYKKRNGNDYYGENYQYIVKQAKEYWQKKDPKRTFKPPT
jgi:hypothetical protein